MGADILLVVSITKNRITQSRESVTAYGMTENILRSQSGAAIAVKALEVESGRILALRQFAKRNNGNRRALDECAAKMESSLESMTFDELAKDTSVPRHKVVIKPTANGSDMQGLDFFIDGNFIAPPSPQMSRRASAKSLSAKVETPFGTTASKSSKKSGSLRTWGIDGLQTISWRAQRPPTGARCIWRAHRIRGSRAHRHGGCRGLWPRRCGG